MITIIFDNNLKNVILIIGLQLIMSFFVGYAMRILICDDEQSYVNDIKKHVELFLTENNFPFEIDTFINGNELLSSNTHYDIAFLDIEIGNIKGTEIAKRLKHINNHIVVFIITAYDKYLDEAMDLNVLRFIVKPIDAKRLYDGMRKAISLIDNSVVDLFVKEGGSLVKVPINDIMFIEVDGKKTIIQTKHSKYYSNNRMKFWKNRLSPSFFFQVHSSFIINMKYISEYERDEVVMNNKYKIPIAYRKQTEFKNYFTNYFSWR